MTQTTPAPYQPASRIALADSPYYLPGVTNDSEPVPAISGVSGAATLRVLGAPEGPPRAFALQFEEAYRACQDVGLGLAALLGDDYKAAADRLLLRAISTLPDDGSDSLGCCPGFIWIGGHRDTLGGPDCTAGAPTYPYFRLGGGADGAGSGYSGCGKDPVFGWAWRVTDANSQVSNVSWSDPAAGSPEKHWYSPSNLGGAGPRRDPQPTGWNGRFALGPEGGFYENCTAAQFVTPAMSPDAALPDAAGEAWYHDFGCEAPLARWICEFEDSQQGVTAALTDPATNDPSATVLRSFFALPGVTGAAVASGLGSQVYRVMGITSERAARIQGSSAPGRGGSITWEDAQSVCTTVGGSGLASFDTGSSQSIARDQLLAAVVPKLPPSSAPAFWIGGASFAAPASDFSLPSAWRWFPKWPGAAGAAASGVPASGSHWQWAAGFPRSDTAHVGAPQGPGGPTSCMAAVWAGGLSSWENRRCDDDNVSLFVCALPSNATGIGTASSRQPQTSPASSGHAALALALALSLCGVALLVLLFSCLAWCACRRRRGRAVAKAAPQDDDGGGLLPLSAGTAANLAASAPAPSPEWAAVLHRSTLSLEPLLTRITTTLDSRVPKPARPESSQNDSTLFGVTTASEPASSLRSDPANDGNFPRSQVHALIASYSKRGVTFAEQYRFLPGKANRREGGQGVVAFATSVYNDRLWAVKFFIGQRSFLEESALYEDPALAHVLPPVRAIVDAQQEEERARLGGRVPSFIVMGHGQPFDEWVASSLPDFPLALQVLLHVGTKLQQIHAAGFAHRDVKPSNVILDSATKQWILIDFASSARIGETRSLSYTLYYAPPELAAALSEERHEEVVDPARDVWSLGVMAWALLTGQPPYESPAEILPKLLGEPLPWEARPLSQAVRFKLGILAPSVLSMLHRDPRRRSSMDQLLAAWRSLFHAGDEPGPEAPDSGDCSVDDPGLGRGGAGSEDGGASRSAAGREGHAVA